MSLSRGSRVVIVEAMLAQSRQNEEYSGLAKSGRQILVRMVGLSDGFPTT